jgi:hypothetical protein
MRPDYGRFSLEAQRSDTNQSRSTERFRNSRASIQGVANFVFRYFSDRLRNKKLAKIRIRRKLTSSNAPDCGMPRQVDSIRNNRRGGIGH